MNDFGFEWDDAKAQSNLRKHGVSFDEATTVFSEWGAPINGDVEHSTDEDRFIIIGMSERDRLLIVAFTYRTEVVRIISARRANRREQQIYEQEKRPD
ncbi:MAG TPA: BrnT family toxin [Thermoanaerobaculia bacterium]